MGLLRRWRTRLHAHLQHEPGHAPSAANFSTAQLDFPPYSPDLNPIENLWSILARRVEQRTCETMEELQDTVADEWNKIEPEVLQNLAHSMPARCQAVIEANGWHTKY